MPAEIVVPLPDPLVPLREVRSTLLSSSLAALRERGLVDRYFELLPAERHPAILSLVAGVWVPADLALAHYRACDGLGVTPEQQQSIGDDVARRIHGSLLGTVVRMARSTGVTMWTGAAQFPRLWDRMFRGGGFAAVKLGPKELRVDVEQLPLVDVAYFRNGLCHTLRATCELFARTVYVRATPRREGSAAASLRISWA